jgi:hypothetical protein
MIDRKYLPSKNFLNALYISLVVIFLAIILNYWRSNTTQYTNDSLVTAPDTNLALANIDSDEDGLPDWKENLLGTNPKVADTDKDGTTDADEISQNRDPLKPNTAEKGEEPNDKTDPIIIEKNQKLIQEYENLTEIDKFSRNLVSNIVASQPVSGSMDQNTMNSILTKSLSEIPQKNYTGKTTIADLNLLKTDSTNIEKNMRDYTISYATQISKLILLLGTDLNLINSYISDGSTSARLEMLKLTDKYQSIVNELIKMPVPVAVGYYDVNYHLTVINDLEKLIAIDKDIVNSDKDSLGIFSNLSIYSAVIKDLFAILPVVDGILKITYSI